MMWGGYDKFWDELDKWATEIGLTRDVITVKQFSLPELYMEIKNLPDFYEAVLNGADDFDEEEHEALLEDIQQWRNDGDFVFVWGNELWMNQAGEIEST